MTLNNQELQNYVRKLFNESSLFLQIPQASILSQQQTNNLMNTQKAETLPEIEIPYNATIANSVNQFNIQNPRFDDQNYQIDEDSLSSTNESDIPTQSSSESIEIMNQNPIQATLHISSITNASSQPKDIIQQKPRDPEPIQNMAQIQEKALSKRPKHASERKKSEDLDTHNSKTIKQSLKLCKNMRNSINNGHITLSAYFSLYGYNQLQRKKGITQSDIDELKVNGIHVSLSGDKLILDFCDKIFEELKGVELHGVQLLEICGNEAPPDLWKAFFSDSDTSPELKIIKLKRQNLIDLPFFIRL